MDSSNAGGAQGTFFDVLALMQRALAMLDASGGVAEVGAHLDLAAGCRNTCCNPASERPKSR